MSTERTEEPVVEMTPHAVMRIEIRHPELVDDGRKEAAVREAFGVSMTRYTQRLNGLLEDPAFISVDPVHARVLRARRARRMRSGRKAG